MSIRPHLIGGNSVLDTFSDFREFHGILAITASFKGILSYDQCKRSF